MEDDCHSGSVFRPMWFQHLGMVRVVDEAGGHGVTRGTRPKQQCFQVGLGSETREGAMWFKIAGWLECMRGPGGGAVFSGRLRVF